MDSTQFCQVCLNDSHKTLQCVQIKNVASSEPVIGTSSIHEADNHGQAEHSAANNDENNKVEVTGAD